MQIEIARAIYLDERRIVRNERWGQLRDDLFAAAKALAGEFSRAAGPPAPRGRMTVREMPSRRRGEAG